MESSLDFGEDDIAKIGLLVEENAKRSRVKADTRVATSEVMIIKLERRHELSDRLSQ